MKKFFLLILAVVLLSGCAARNATFETPTVTTANDEKSLVTFVMGRFKHPISIWDGDVMKGLLMPRALFQIEVEPGEHLFLGSYGNRVVPLEVNLAAGKHYIIRARIFPAVGLRFQPIRGLNVTHEQVQGWFHAYDAMKTDLTKLENYEKTRRRYTDRFVKYYIKSMYPEYILKPEDNYRIPITL